MGTQILIAVLALLLGTFMGLVIAWCFHKRQMRASKQSQEALHAHLQQIKKEMAEGFKMLWSALNPGRVITPEAETNLQKASETISSALLEPFYAAGTILAGDVFAVYPDPQKSAAERQGNDQDDTPPPTYI